MADEGEDAKEAEVVDHQLLTEELIKANLSQCGKAGSTGRKEFAFHRLDVRSKKLRAFDVQALEHFKELQYVSIASNEFSTLAPAAALENLVLLDAQKNTLTSISDFGGQLEHMQVLQVDHCRIEDLQGYNLAPLTTLTMSNNSVRGFKDLVSEKPIALQVLDLSSNNVSSLDGIGFFKELRVLNLHRNKLESLEGVQDLPKLTHLNVGENQLQPADLEILAEMSLTHLVIEGNAAIDAFVGEEGTLLSFVYDRMPDLLSLNGVIATEEQRRAAQDIKNAARRAAEDEARAAQAQAQAEAAEAAVEAQADAAEAAEGEDTVEDE
jgi:hypothetical protein